MKTKKYLWIFLFIIAILTPSIIYLLSNQGSNPIIMISGFLGITAYVLFTFQFLLAARIKVIDRQFGLDKIYRFHMIMALVAIILAYIHKLIKETFYSESFKTQMGENALVIFIVISIFSILLMIKKLFIKVPLVDTIRKFLDQTLKLKHQYKVMLHNLVMIALVFLLIHILLAFSIKSNLLLQIVMILYFAISLGAYLNRKVLHNFRKNHKYKISNVIEETDQIITLKMQPQSGEIFQYLPGQFLYIKIKNPNIPTDEHPFTISSSPLQKDYISITAKKLGDFTNKLNLAEIGNEVQINGAYGTFSYLKHSTDKKLCFIAGGIGITPFLSMLRYMSISDKNREVILLWGVRNLDEIICAEELKQFAVEIPGFKLIPVVSDDKNYSGEKGYIGMEVIKRQVEKLGDYEFYVCGPPIMLELQLSNLKKLGVGKKNIHFERFSI